MERIELARIIHQERQRSLEVELQQRRLLRGDDAIVTPTTTSAATKVSPRTRTTPAVHGVDARRASEGTQPSVSSRRTSSLLR